MRIISGKYGGRNLPISSRFKARPTTDKAKEGLFNILNFEIDYQEIKVLDLFAGTGNISFEFASRGVEDVTAVEMKYEHYSQIRKTNELLNAGVKVQRSDVFRYLSKILEQFDLVFADPPYDLKDFPSVLVAVKEANVLKTNGLFILEHSDEFSFSNDDWFLHSRKYGKVQFSFFRNDS